MNDAHGGVAAPTPNPDESPSSTTTAPESARGEEEPPPARSLQRQETAASSSSADDGDGNDSSEGRGSGTGYAADCSASDQSSDSTAGGGAGGRKLPLHHLQLSIEANASDATEKGSQKAKDPRKSRQSSAPSMGDPELDPADCHESNPHQGPSLPQDAGRLEGLLRSTTRHVEGASLQLPPGLRPQWNGVRLTDVMDPRFDVHQHGLGLREQLTRQISELLAAPALAPSMAVADAASEAAATAHQQSIDHYLMLQELCRPFYQHLAQPNGSELKEGIVAEKDGKGTEEESDPSSEGFTSFFTTTHSSNNGSSSDGDKNNKMLDEKQNAPQEDKEMQAESKGETSFGDSSRIADNPSDGTAPERQARIQQHNVQGLLSESAPSQGGREPRLGHVPRIVTESSGTNTNSASGGSTINHASGTSNLGSSGSGNDKGSSEEGKGTGSSEDLAAKSNNSGDGTNEGSDDADCSLPEERCKVGASSKEPNPQVKTDEDSEMEDAAREHKRLDKKRKRIEMRRQYEAQQQSESSDNSHSLKHGDILRPGKSYTLEQVLQFSEIPRILVQSRPPFLVVHTNAAYSRLTGIDSHKVVGKPIRDLLSIQLPALSENHPDHETTLDGLSEVELQQKMVCLERLIASSGFGKVHDILVHVAPSDLPASNVTFSSMRALPVENSADDVAESQLLVCKAAVAPILSPFFEFCTSDGMHKRRKHGHTFDTAHRKQPPQQHLARITHFVVQLFPYDAAHGDTADSISSGSTSVQARLLGLSKEKLVAQMMATRSNDRDLGVQAEGDEPMDSDGDDDEEDISDSTDQTKLAVSAIG